MAPQSDSLSLLYLQLYPLKQIPHERQNQERGGLVIYGQYNMDLQRLIKYADGELKCCPKTKNHAAVAIFKTY